MKFLFLAALIALSSCSQSSCVNVIINRVVAQKTDVFDTNSAHSLSGYLSVVRLTMKNKEKKDSGIAATGFAVSKDYVLTAGHFCKDYVPLLAEGKIEDTIYAIRFDGKKFIEKNGFVIKAINEKIDECILYKKDHHIKPVKLVKNYSSVKVGDKITIIGSPNAIYPSKTEGYVSLPNNKLYIQKSISNRLMLSVHIYPGSSGSPVFDVNNKVIGMVVVGAPGICGAVRGDVLMKFINKSGIRINQ